MCLLGLATQVPNCAAITLLAPAHVTHLPLAPALSNNALHKRPSSYSANPLRPRPNAHMPLKMSPTKVQFVARGKAGYGF